jgi:hypothetical protein
MNTKKIRAKQKKKKISLSSASERYKPETHLQRNSLTRLLRRRRITGRRSARRVSEEGNERCVFVDVGFEGDCSVNARDGGPSEGLFYFDF